MTEKERYDWYKAEGWCCCCGRQKSAEDMRYVNCYDCREKINARRRNRYENRTDEQRIADNAQREFYRRRKRAQRKEARLCVYCGRKANASKTMCFECIAYYRKLSRQRRERNGVISTKMRLSGLWCYLCCKPKPDDGKKLCPECTEKVTQNILKGRKKPGEHHVWRVAEHANYLRWEELQRRKKEGGASVPVPELSGQNA